MTRIRAHLCAKKVALGRILLARIMIRIMMLGVLLARIVILRVPYYWKHCWLE